MAFLTNTDQLRPITWGTKYLWDLWFEGAPAPFDKFFPAVDVEEDVAHLDSYTFDTAQDVHRVPQSTSTLQLRITFHDSEDHALLKWFRDWVNTTILNDGKFISTVDKSARLVKLLKLNHQRDTLEEKTYYVYPEGTLAFSGDSSSDPIIYTIQFVIVGKSK